jgi:hypothetical protein
MNHKQSEDLLLTHPDPDVREAAVILHSRLIRLAALMQEIIQKLRLDMKYLIFDLESTRQERNFLMEKYQG